MGEALPVEAELVTDVSAVVLVYHLLLPDRALGRERQVWRKAGGQSCQTALVLFCEAVLGLVWKQTFTSSF